MAVAEVFCALLCIRRITMLGAIVISWADVMKDADQTKSFAGLSKTRKLQKQRFGALLLTIDTVK
ncbi:hypothetical protein ABC383_28040 [Noviherbaspirillum sp. 1P10PC]|uniref:hypothetical protein n=1 Tax=Noviherbaspirillum sp. 1P10PC TaxID=3132292 RepID=UPI00399F0920